MNLNKIVAFAIGVSVISGSIAAPVFASDVTQNTQITTMVQTQVNQKSVITLDEAIKSAISTSETLALDEKKISYNDRINDVNEEIDDNPQLVGKTEIEMGDDRKDLNEDTRDIKQKQYKQQRDFDEDKLIQKVTTSYNDIVTSQMKIDKAKKDIELKNKDLSVIKVKNDVGSAISVDVDANTVSLEDLQNKLKSSESALKDAQYNFKLLTGKDVTQYSLEQDIKYDAFKIDGSVEDYLDNDVENYLKYSIQIVKLNKDYLNDKDHKVDDVNSKDRISETKPTFVFGGDVEAYKEYSDKLDGYYQERYVYAYKLSMRLAYLNAKIGTYEAETNLDETKKQFKEQLRNFHTMLTTTQDNINLLKKNIELNNKQLRILKVKYDAELITKTDYDYQIANSEELDIQLRSAIDRYNTLKEEIQKPWIVFSK